MRFIDFLTESVNDKGIFKSVFICGCPGSGKSYTRQRLGGSIDPRVVNTDTWTEFLKAYGDEKWHFFSEKIKHLSTEQLVLYMNSVLPLFVEGTSAVSSAVFRREGILKSLGYDTAFIWVETPIEIALERASKRERPVDPKFIKDMYDKVGQLKPFYKSQFKYFFEISNGEGELSDNALSKLYTKIQGWYSKPLENPIGIQTVEKLRERKEKYLTDSLYSMDQLRRLVFAWYKGA